MRLTGWFALFVMAIVAALAVGPSSALAREHRSHAVTREFQREHPCPSTGRTIGACPGYWKDHIVPLACGGPDTVANLQWQTIADAGLRTRGSARRALTAIPKFFLKPSYRPLTARYIVP